MKNALRVSIIIAALLAMLAAFTGVAQSQDDGPAITISGDDVTVEEGEGDDDVDTYTVPEAGTYDLTIDGTGFSLQVFVLQCPGAAGDLEVLAEGDASSLCDLGNLMPGVPDADGAFTVTFEGVEVDGCGLVLAAGDAAQTESASVLLSVETPPDDVVCEVVETEGYDATAQAGDDDADGAAGQDGEGSDGDTAGAGGELADTGLNSVELGLVAIVVAMAGALITTEARKMSRRRTIG